MSFAVLIPARLGATRLPGKPLLDIAGRALIVHVCERARESGADLIRVATDHADIADAVCAAGFSSVMTSPAHESGTDRLAEAAAVLGLADEDIVVNLQGDEPLMPPALIRQVAQLLADDPQASLASLYWPLEAGSEDDPDIVKVVFDAGGYASYFSRAPIPFQRDSNEPVSRHRHIGLYAYRVGYLSSFTASEQAPLERAEKLEQLRALHMGHRLRLALAQQEPPVGVDTEQDLARVRALLEGQADRN